MDSEKFENNKIKEKQSQNRTYTYNDYLKWNDEKRYELIDGVIYDKTPAPSRKHQEISGEIFRQMANYFSDKNCNIYFAPFDVRLPLHDSDSSDKNILTVVQPDISVICDKTKLDKRGCKGPPDLIVEILSPNTGGKDRKIKRNLYEKHRVKEYWIVDYHEKTVEIYLQNESKEYSKPQIYSDNDLIEVNTFPDLQIDLKLIFNYID